MPSLLKVGNKMFYDGNFFKNNYITICTSGRGIRVLQSQCARGCRLTVGEESWENVFRVLSNQKEIKMREVEELENNAFAGKTPVNGVIEDVFSNKSTRISFPKLKKVGEKKGFSNSKMGYFMNKELRKNLISFLMSFIIYSELRIYQKKHIK